MDFQPINSDHAIESAVFASRFNVLIDDDDILALHAQMREYRDILPFVSLQQVSIIDASVPFPSAQQKLMLDASMLRADGTAIWNLRVSGYEAVVTCTRYSRWQKTWGQARQLILFVAETMKRRQTDVFLSNLALTVTDRFLASDQKYQLSDLFKINDFVPQFAYKRGPKWHCHTGWFEAPGGFEVLNHLNIDARYDPEASSFDSDGSTLSILHRQQANIKALGETASLTTTLDQTMQELHIQNKRVLECLLKEEVLNMIGLRGNENG
ncbi:hypothetical protein [Asticcacaulis sp.]|uniref:hypothetical protein n=1 Tax=Asticcacaulis sp. TaxID=1872648 RepID=UPI0031CEA7CB